MRTLADRLCGVVDGGAHQTVPEQHREVVGARVKDFGLQIAVVTGSQGVVEDDAFGHDREAAQLVQGTEDIQIGGSPGVAAAARVACFGDPHLAAEAVDVPLFGVELCHIGGDRQILFGVGLVGFPVGKRHHRLQTLGHAIVIVVAVNVQLLLGTLHQVVGRALGQDIADSAALCLLAVLFQHTFGGAGADKGAVGVVLMQPADKNVLIADILLGGVALGAAGHGQQVGLVDELSRVDGLAVLLAQGKDLLCLAGVPGLVGMVQTLTVRHRDQELCADVLAEIQHTEPLLAGQDGVVALRDDAVRVAVEVVIGLGGPGAGHAHPGRADLFGQLAQLLVGEVDGIIILHQVGACGRVAEEAALEDERLCARDLSGGVSLPEGAAGDFGHLDVVGDQPLVANVQLAQGAGVQVHELCHGKFSFSQVFCLHP